MKWVKPALVVGLLLGMVINAPADARGRGGHGGAHVSGRHSGGAHHGGHFGGRHHFGGHKHFRGGHFRGHSGRHHFHGHSRFGFFIGAPWGWPYYPYYPYYSYYPYYRSYAYPPAIIPAPSTPPVYIEQSGASAPAAAPPEPDYWRYCENPEGYYPYVKECPAGWQNVATRPAKQEVGYWYHCDDPQGYYPYVRECSQRWTRVIPGSATTQTPTTP